MIVALFLREAVPSRNGTPLSTLLIIPQITTIAFYNLQRQLAASLLDKALM